MFREGYKYIHKEKKSAVKQMQNFSPDTLNFLESLQEDTCQRNPTRSQETERDEAEASCTWTAPDHWFLVCFAN